MIKIRISQNYGFNKEHRQMPDVDSCAVCGAAVPRPYYHIRMFWGDTAVTEDEAQKIIAEEGSGGDLLYYPVGTRCFRMHPELKPYVEDAKSQMEKNEPLRS